MKDLELIKNTEKTAGELLKLLEINADCKVSMESEDDCKFLKVALEGNDLGLLIGYRGNTLNSLQLIFNQMVNKDKEEPISVLFDINNYRERRNDYLRSLARKACDESRENKQDVELPPLSSYERRVIHMALKEEKGIKTESTGEGEERHIVVKFIKK